MAFQPLLLPSPLCWIPYHTVPQPGHILIHPYISVLAGPVFFVRNAHYPSWSTKLLWIRQGPVQMLPSLWRFPHLWAITALVTLYYSYLFASLGYMLLEDRNCLLIILTCPVFGRQETHQCFLFDEGMKEQSNTSKIHMLCVVRKTTKSFHALL